MAKKKVAKKPIKKAKKVAPKTYSDEYKNMANYRVLYAELDGRDEIVLPKTFDLEGQLDIFVDGRRLMKEEYLFKGHTIKLQSDDHLNLKVIQPFNLWS